MTGHTLEYYKAKTDRLIALASILSASQVFDNNGCRDRIMKEIAAILEGQPISMGSKPTVQVKSTHVGSGGTHRIRKPK